MSFKTFDPVLNLEETNYVSSCKSQNNRSITVNYCLINPKIRDDTWRCRNIQEHLQLCRRFDKGSISDIHIKIYIYHCISDNLALKELNYGMKLRKMTKCHVMFVNLSKLCKLSCKIYHSMQILMNVFLLIILNFNTQEYHISLSIVGLRAVWDTIGSDMGHHKTAENGGTIFFSNQTVTQEVVVILVEALYCK